VGKLLAPVLTPLGLSQIPLHGQPTSDTHGSGPASQTQPSSTSNGNWIAYAVGWIAGPGMSDGELKSQRANRLMMLGAGFIAAGLVMLVLVNWILKPLLLPTLVWWGPMVAGGIFIGASFWLPAVNDWVWNVLTLGAIGLVIVLAIPGWIANRKEKAASQPPAPAAPAGVTK
jgi:hypothetical protein